PSPYPSPPKTGERGPSGERIPAPSLLRPFERLPYDDAFRRHAGRAVLTEPVTVLHDVAQQHQLTPPPGLDAADRDGWLNWLLAELVEPKLGHERPAFLCDYPPTQAALARTEPRADGQLVAKRVELYIAGVEYCNGYDELTDADVLRERNRQQNALRQSAGLRPLPEQSRLLAAMERGLPPCSGVALGFDRLAMLAMGADRIDQVIPFPWERA
ncbi:MAG TPA: amino acid--tRNA ligase-related protein, partial [Planctomycetaceae bacterium]|nr:amino acid--tRNA ligase-related protein [Planctomycetaceae bacterium]